MSDNVEVINNPSNKEPRITDETLCKLFDDTKQFDDLIIIDCRSIHEYSAGHIKTAIRCHPTETNDNILNLYNRLWRPRVCFVFHCEFSKYRGPTGYRYFAQVHQRSKNSDQKLNAYILDGGFYRFFALHQDYCVGTYIPEIDIPIE
ncbi:hypothetical protein M9Y10_022517 [Tritrichomonas musculus]|uniref:protein-tyrosine-phosphatase n=1 Tax=Tritrichomonas musculus TaxID=1915356 RepID=A0ABR2KSJ3_9EUKA